MSLMTSYLMKQNARFAAFTVSELLKENQQGGNHPFTKIRIKMIDGENNVPINVDLVIVRGLLNESKHTCSYKGNEHPRNFKVGLSPSKKKLFYLLQ